MSLSAGGICRGQQYQWSAYSPLDYFTGCCSIEGLVATDGGG